MKVGDIVRITPKRNRHYDKVGLIIGRHTDEENLIDKWILLIEGIVEEVNTGYVGRARGAKR